MELSVADDRTATGSGGYVMPTVDCRPEDVSVVGGKAVGLGSLLRADQQVPASFVVTARAYIDYLAGRDAAGQGQLPAAVRDPVVAAYDGLCAQRQATVVVAVRSSATVEDSRDASYAGQFRTFLGVCGAEDVLSQVEQCWISAAEPHVESYRSSRQIDPDDGGVAVVVQELVRARASGVMFTQHPRTGDRSLVVIEASYGLGEAVVGGEVTPDLFEVNKITGQIHERRLGVKQVEHRLAADLCSVEVQPVALERQRQWSISDEEVSDLVAMAADLETKLGRGLDIEWAIGATGSAPEEIALFALQVRPITVDSSRANRPAGASSSPIDFVLGRLSGQTNSGGAA